MTPVGQVFELYAAHQGGQALRTIFSAPGIDYDRDGKTARFWGLNGSGSIKGKTLLLTVVNPHVSAPHQGEIMIHPSTAKSATATVLTGTGGDLRSRNTFDSPHGVVSLSQSIKMRDNGFVFDFHLVDLFGVGAKQAAQADAIVLFLDFVAVFGVEENGVAAAAAIGGDDDACACRFENLDHFCD